MTICDLKKGECARVIGISATPTLKDRLHALNVYPQALITLIKKSRLSCNYLLQAGSVRLAVRQSLAREIRVVKV